MGLRSYAVVLSAAPKRLSDAYGVGAAGVADAASDIPYRQLLLQASGAAVYLGSSNGVTIANGLPVLVGAEATMLGPFSTGPSSSAISGRWARARRCKSWACRSDRELAMLKSFQLPLSGTPLPLSLVYDTYVRQVLADGPNAYWRLNGPPAPSRATPRARARRHLRQHRPSASRGRAGRRRCPSTSPDRARRHRRRRRRTPAFSLEAWFYQTAFDGDFEMLASRPPRPVRGTTATGSTPSLGRSGSV
jgi:hypothetical protein